MSGAYCGFGFAYGLYQLDADTYKIEQIMAAVRWLDAVGYGTDASQSEVLNRQMKKSVLIRRLF